MTTAEVLVKCLEAQGVKYVFGIPGEENLAFLEALRTSSITLVITRHEQAAVFMAATFGRLTGKAGVALSTLGPEQLILLQALRMLSLVVCLWLLQVKNQFEKASKDVFKSLMSFQ